MPNAEGDRDERQGYRIDVGQLVQPSKPGCETQEGRRTTAQNPVLHRRTGHPMGRSSGHMLRRECDREKERMMG